MARPVRIEYAGALHHVMARGNGRGDVFVDDDDRAAFLYEFARICERFDWVVWSYCLMGNHYHLLVETRRPTLSRGMRELNVSVRSPHLPLVDRAPESPRFNRGERYVESGEAGAMAQAGVGV